LSTWYIRIFAEPREADRGGSGDPSVGQGFFIVFCLLSAEVCHVCFCFLPGNTCQKSIRKSHILLSEGGAGKEGLKKLPDRQVRELRSIGIHMNQYT
jgi:hypothetical protein